MKRFRVTMYAVLLVLLATACAKREAAPVEGVRPASVGQALPDDSNTTVLQKKLLEAMVKGLSDGAFRDGLSKGLGFERDGDSEVLLAEMMSPTRTRGTEWSEATASFLQHFANRYDQPTRGASPTFLDSLLSANPLQNVLFVPAEDNYSGDITQGLTDPRLAIVIAPTGCSERHPESLLVYDRNGKSLAIDVNAEKDRPLLVLGVSERITVEGIGGMGPEAQLYFEYMSCGTDNIEGAGSEHRHYYYKMPHDDHRWSQETGGSGTPIGTKVFRSAVLGTQEFLVKAHFTSQDAMRLYESRWRGRPEVVCHTYMQNQHNTWSYSDKGWWNGAWKDCGNEIGRWEKRTLVNDFYSVSFVEVDEGDIATFTLECSVAGLSMHTKANINLNDDLICNQSVHFRDDTDEHNQHTYRCGDTFEFVIEVRK